MFAITHVSIVTEHEFIDEGMVVVENGRITAIESSTHPINCQTFNGSGMMLAPGFIDLQLNGGFGHDFTDDPATIWRVAAQLPQFGVTSFLPTIITCPLGMVARAQNTLTSPPANFKGATPLGLHVEGPFLHPLKRGAHKAGYLQLPDETAVSNWRPETGVRLVTVAPELYNATSFIQQLNKQGVVVSAGHSTASYEEAQAGLAAGIRYGTHLFNAMPSLNHRTPGLVGALLTDDRAMIGLIPDGIHVHPAMVKMIWQAVGNGRLTLVTDSMAAMGMPPGNYQIGNAEVQVTDDTSTLLDGTLAGSIVTMDAALQKFIQFAQCRFQDALPLVTQNPARLLNESSIGRMAVGCQADLVLLSASGEVQATFIDGELVFNKQATTNFGSLGTREMA